MYGVWREVDYFRSYDEAVDAISSPVFYVQELMFVTITNNARRLYFGVYKDGQFVRKDWLLDWLLSYRNSGSIHAIFTILCPTLEPEECKQFEIACARHTIINYASKDVLDICLYALENLDDGYDHIYTIHPSLYRLYQLVASKNPLIRSSITQMGTMMSTNKLANFMKSVFPLHVLVPRKLS